jgi:hypothetical protein
MASKDNRVCCRRANIILLLAVMAAVAVGVVAWTVERSIDISSAIPASRDLPARSNEARQLAGKGTDMSQLASNLPPAASQVETALFALG